MCGKCGKRFEEGSQETINEDLFQKSADEIQEEYKMGGLAEGLYYDFAMDTCKRYLQKLAEGGPDG